MRTATNDKATLKKPAAKKKIAAVMHEYAEGELKSPGGRPVTDRKQAIAIGLSEARRAGKKKAEAGH